MDFSLEEHSEVMDLNKSFYLDPELEVDLCAAEEPDCAEAELDLRQLSLAENGSESSSQAPPPTRPRPAFQQEELLRETLDTLQEAARQGYKTCRSCRQLLSLQEVRAHERRCRRGAGPGAWPGAARAPLCSADQFQCLRCERRFGSKSSLVVHCKGRRSCGPDSALLHTTVRTSSSSWSSRRRLPPRQLFSSKGASRGL